MSNSEPTTALETLGTYISGGQRDAIHLAVVPITATEKVYPGQHLTAEGRANGISVGICDPFLPGPVMIGQSFWLVLYPRTITSLSHTWTHPAFPEKRVSEEWLHTRAERLGVTYRELIEALDESYGAEDGFIGFGIEIEGDRDIEPELWEHAEKVLGRKFIHRPTYFRCAC